MTQGMLPPETSLDDVKIRIKKSYSNPNVRTITQAVLKEGPKAYKVATLLEVINPQNDEFHHYSLKIDHIDKLKAGWSYKPDKSVRLEGKDPDEIEKLYKFLHAAYERVLGNVSGEMHLISSTDYAKFENLLEALPQIANTEKLHLVGKLLSQLDETTSNTSLLVRAFEESNTETLNHIATAARLVMACPRFHVLIDKVA